MAMRDSLALSATGTLTINSTDRIFCVSMHGMNSVCRLTFSTNTTEGSIRSHRRSVTNTSDDIPRKRSRMKPVYIAAAIALLFIFLVNPAILYGLFAIFMMGAVIYSLIA